MKLSVEIAKLIKEKGGTAYYVGGYVRDQYWSVPSKDLDIEVHGISQEVFEEIIAPYDPSFIGKSFGIYMIDKTEWALPRREISTGILHTDFDIIVDPFMGLIEACMRRDFTINTGMMNVLTRETTYPIEQAESDLHWHMLRPTSHLFMDDALRVLRGMQLASRFSLVHTSSAITYAQRIKRHFSGLSPERVWTEWWKWAGGKWPGHGLDYLLATGWIDNFPELKGLVGLPQDPIWHPESCVWTHTNFVCQAIARHKDPYLTMAALLHDVGKQTTTEYDDRITSKGHDKASKPFIESFLANAPNRVREVVTELVSEHMIAVNPPTKRTARRLLSRLRHADWDDLQKLIQADHAGRPPLDPSEPEHSVRLFEYCQEVKDYIEPILKGRHLIEMGFEPNHKFGTALKYIYEIQLDGDAVDIDGAKSFLETALRNNLFELDGGVQ